MANHYPEYGDVSKEVGEYLAKIERVHQSAGIGNAAFVERKTNELNSGLSSNAKKELENLRQQRDCKR